MRTVCVLSQTHHKKIESWFEPPNYCVWCDSDRAAGSTYRGWPSVFYERFINIWQLWYKPCVRSLISITKRFILQERQKQMVRFLNNLKLIIDVSFFMSQWDTNQRIYCTVLRVSQETKKYLAYWWIRLIPIADSLSL